jgi:hypothetical protein
MSTLRTLNIANNAISAPVLTSLEFQMVLCQLRNAHVTEIDASYKSIDDADATRMAEVLRCAIEMRLCDRMRFTYLPSYAL